MSLPTILNITSNLQKKIADFLNDKLEECPLTLLDYQILHIINDANGCSQEYIVKELGINKSTVAKYIQSDLLDGYIFRKTAIDDKRYKELYLSPLGEKEVHFFNGLLDELNDKLSASLSDEQFKQLTILLNQINDNFDLL